MYVSVWLLFSTGMGNAHFLILAHAPRSESRVKFSHLHSYTRRASDRKILDIKRSSNLIFHILSHTVWLAYSIVNVFSYVMIYKLYIRIPVRGFRAYYQRSRQTNLLKKRSRGTVTSWFPPDPAVAVVARFIVECPSPFLCEENQPAW